MHDGGDHPERPARIGAVMAGIADLHLGTDVHVLPATPAEIGQLTRVHAPGYLEELKRFSAQGGDELDPDTYADHASWDAACLAAGAGIAAIDELGHTATGVAFVAARPPGHHALRDRSMGFCLINNVAVAAAHLGFGFAGQPHRRAQRRWASDVGWARSRTRKTRTGTSDKKPRTTVGPSVNRVGGT